MTQYFEFGARTRVIMIDSDRDDADATEATLQSSWTSGGVEFHHVTTIEDAIRDLPDPSSTCLLLEIDHDGHDGIGALVQLKSAAPDHPVVVLTRRDDEVMAILAVQSGAQDYLVKARADGPLLARTIRHAIERKRGEVQLAHQALHDQLTGLPNRALFMDRLKLTLLRGIKRVPSGLGVLYLDIDRFKVINESLGHDAGDELLVAVGDRLKQTLRPGDTVARFGGDEFAVLCDEIGDAADVVIVAERVAKALSPAYYLYGKEVRVTASIGISVAASVHTTADQLVRDADSAMYRAKERGRGRYEIFDQQLHVAAVKRLEIESALHLALDRGEFRVFYQPEVSLETNLIVGVEALVRWEHPQRGLVSPLEFIPVAEDSSLIVRLGDWVLREACRQGHQWQLDYPTKPVMVSVNLSARQLNRPELVESVDSALRDTQMRPEDLCLEITEGVLMEDVESTLSALRALKELGISLSVDDFGTGYSSLSYLKKFPVDMLKVDKSFVDGLGVDLEDSAIVNAIISLAHALGLRSVAEGVETVGQLSQLRTLGCDLFQGYFFARPQPGESLAELLLREGIQPAKGG